MIFYSVYFNSSVANQRKIMADSAFQAVRIFLEFNKMFGHSEKITVEVPRDRISHEGGFKATKDCKCYVPMIFEIGIMPTLGGWEEVILFSPQCDWEKIDGSKIIPIDLVVGLLKVEK